MKQSPKTKKSLVIYMAAVFFIISFIIGGSSCGRNGDAGSAEEIGSSNSVNNNTPPDSGDKLIAERLDEFHKWIWDDTVYENTLYYISYEQSSENPDVEQAVVVRIDLDRPDSPVIIPLAIPPEQLAVHIAIDDNGSIHILTIENKEFGYWGELVDMFWHQINDDGEITHTVVMPPTIHEQDTHLPQDFEIDAAGNATIGMRTSFTQEYTHHVFVINSEGELLMEIPIRKMIWYLFKDDRGVVWVHHYPTTLVDEGVTTFVMTEIDIESMSSRDVDITAFAAQQAGFLGLSIDGDTLFASTIYDVFDVDMDSMVATERFAWKSVEGLRLSREGRVYPLANGNILLGNKAEGMGAGQALPIPYFVIRKETAADIALAEQRALEWEDILTSDKVGDITLGVIGRAIDLAIGKAIDEFNQTHPYSQISIKQYGSLYGDDQSEGLSQLNNDIIRGNSPDILLLHQDISYGAYVKQGLFQDLYPYLEADEGFDMGEYRENIIKAYDVGGGLYGFPIAFTVEFLYGHAADLTGINSWNMDEFIAFADRFPESRIFRFPTKTDVLDICLKANGGNMVDWVNDTGLDMELLVKKLEFANRFVNADSFVIDQTVTERAMMGDVRLMSGYAMPSTQSEMEILGGRAISHVGFPSENGNGYLVSSDKVVAISSSCQHTTTAWQFISYLLSDEVQSSNELLGYPVKRDSIESRVTAAKEWAGTMGVYDHRGDLQLSYDARGATDDEINLFLEILDKATEIRVTDMQIDSIIKEEAGAYFSGQKTVEEVVAIIANRVGVYVKEVR
jgi:ABC-type glycerol-3-phosphate transport system substrate-binding protein